MKKIISYALMVSAFLVVLLVTMPMMISWDQYKEIIQDKFFESTGRSLSINGGLQLSLLPSPQASLKDVVIANPEGALSKQFATIKRLDIGIALLPLFERKVKIQSVNIYEPAITMEVMADGTKNWIFSRNKVIASESEKTKESSAIHDVIVQSLRVDKAFIRWVNTPEKKQIIVGPFDGDFQIASLQGPFSGRGTWMINQDIPLRYELKVDALDKDGTKKTPVKLSVSIPGNRAEAVLEGSFSTVQTLQAQLQTVVKTDHLDKLFGELPDFLSRKASLTGSIDINNGQFEMNNLLVNSGALELSGGLSYKVKPRSLLSFDLARIQLPTTLQQQASQELSTKKERLVDRLQATHKVIKTLLDQPVSISDLDVILTANYLALPKLPEMRDIRVALSISDRQMTLQGLSIRLPGQTTLEMTGVMPKEKDHRFSSLALDTVIKTGNIRAVFDKDNSASASSALQLNADMLFDRNQISIDPLVIVQNNQKLTTTILYSPQDKTALTVSAKGDFLNLNNFIPNKPNTATDPDVISSSRSISDSFSLLDGIKAKIKAEIKTIEWNAKRLNQVLLTATADKQGLEIDQLFVSDLNGMTFKANGMIASLSPLSGVNLSLNVNTDNFSQFMKQIGNDNASNMKQASFVADIKGNEESLKLNMKGTIDDGIITLLSDVQKVSNNPIISGNVSVEYPETATVVKNFLDFSPQKTFGKFTMKSDFSFSNQQIDLRNLDIELGKAGSLTGIFSSKPSGNVKELNIDLASPLLDLDALRGYSSQSSTQNSLPSSAQKRWSNEPLDLNIVQNTKGVVKLNFKKARVNELSLDNFNLKAEVKNNSVNINPITASIFESGQLKSTIQFNVLPSNNKIESGVINVDLKNIDAKKLFTSFGNQLFHQGLISLDQDITFNGSTIAQLVSSLSGKGVIEVKDPVINGIDLDRLAEKLDRPNSLSDFAAIMDQARAGGMTATTDFTAQLSIQNGIIQLGNTLLKTQKTSMNLDGIIRLPEKDIDLTGQISFVEQRKLPALTLFVKGPISSPQRSFDTRSFTTFYAQKAAEKIQGRLQERIQDKIGDVLGSPQNSAPVEPAPVTPTEMPPAMPAPKSRDEALKELGTEMLKNVLGGGSGGL